VALAERTIVEEAVSEERTFPKEPLDLRLARVIFQPDSEPHIVLDPGICARCRIEQVCAVVCPAGNYQYDASAARMNLSADSCMECGACRIACTEAAVTWRWPRGGLGVCYVRG
jgi:ferredoxin like protein